MELSCVHTDTYRSPAITHMSPIGDILTVEMGRLSLTWDLKASSHFRRA